MALRRRLGGALRGWQAAGAVVPPPQLPSVEEPPRTGPYSLPAHLRAHPPADLVTVGMGTLTMAEVMWFWGDNHRCRVGNYCGLHPSAKIFVGGEHRVDWISTFALKEAFGMPGRYEGDPDGLPHSRGDVIIGSDVWVGMGATIMSGVTVGDGAVVGAMAVVAKDIPPFAVVVGNPGSIIRYRFGPAEREALLRVRWWDWPESKILDNLDLLTSPRIRQFLDEHDEAYRASPDSAKSQSTAA